ncbi:laminin subunit alpha-4 [Bombina bombina]|uniref:laminin subunit alpha-4 n=1 Tax=Bombina bombina TaxID=8345 RepID=UPI00235A71C4|nr:laminin subunit alpha-4 [Bombina bombina]
MAYVFPWHCAYLFISLCGYLSPCSASPEGSAFFLETEGSSSAPSKVGSTVVDLQHAYIPAKLVPLSQRCQSGFYYSVSGECLQCNCNGNSNKCLDGSGACVDCQRNTTGKHCDVCPTGYRGDTTGGVLRSCLPCPCPLPFSSNNFAITCGIRHGSVRCICKENYAGPKCERCAPGYYGNPLLKGSICKKCDCSGNSDPNLIFEDCNEVTGQCNNCLRKTSGFHCEKCAPGYYGDARVAKNCTECLCNKCGTEFCNDVTGRCHCKPGVTGVRCDHCVAGYYGYDSCLGCQKCECGLASVDRNCDLITQQCTCNPGAGGLKCERCKSGYWNYGPSGCQKCNCGGGPCNNRTGECMLEDPDAPTGSDCSTYNCDKCIWDLIDDVRLSALLVNETKTTILSISTGVAIQRHLNEINSTVFLLTGELEEKNNHSVFTNIQIDNTETEVDILQAEVNEIADLGNLAEMKGFRVHKETMETMNRAKLIAEQVRDLEDGIQETLEKLEYFESLQAEVTSFDRVRNLFTAEQILDEIAQLNFSSARKLVNVELEDMKELLDEIVEDWETKHNNTLSLFPDVLEALAEHNDKVTELQEALEEARVDIRKTTDKNIENAIRAQMNNNQLHNVLKVADSTNETLTVSRIILNDTHTAITDIGGIIKNMSRQDAAIDGANRELQEKISNLSRDVEDIVNQAVDHSAVLQRQAEGLTSDLKDVDTNGLVQKAIEASNVYEKIVNVIDEANETAAVALNIAERVNDAVDGMDDQINYHKNKSMNLFTQAKELSADMSNDLGLVDTKQRVDAAIFRKKALKEKLADAVNQLEISEDEHTRKRIENSKLIAEEALNITAMLNKVTEPMSKNANLWTMNLNNNEYDASAYNNVVNSAGEAVKNLTEVVPLLLSKLHAVDHKWPSNNISSSIQRIRELIAQTRSVASKVQVSMKFGGDSSVNVNLKTNVADLKAYSSMSLYINPTEYLKKPGDRFIMYLGNKNAKSDYMGLAIKNNNLVYVYNLGSGDVEIPLHTKSVNTWPAYFSLVKIERLGRHGKVLLTIPSQGTTDEALFINKGEAPGNDALLDMDPDNTVLYVGGVPAGFKLPTSLTLPGFVGCLELSTLNNDVISLYNFWHIYNINTATAPPCVRNKLAFTQSRAASYFFDGSGYAVVRNIERRGRFTQVTRFDIEVRTPVDNALVFLMVNGTKFFSLEIQDGYIRVLYDFGFSKGPVLLDDTQKKFKINDAKYHEISVIYHNFKKMILVIDRRHVKSVDNERLSIPFTDIYIGGAPSSILQSVKSHLAIDIPYKGCMKGFQFQKKDFNLLEEPETLGISNGCPEESLMSRSAYFNGQSFIASSQKLAPFDAFEGGFSFKTLQPSGLLLSHSDGADKFSISMEKGAVVLRVRDVQVQSTNAQYNDGLNHFLVASVSSTRYHLLVDETDTSFQDRQQTTPNPPVDKKFYFGGSPVSFSQANFTGCISNAYFTRVGRDVEVEDFQKYTEKISTSLYGCPVESPPIALLYKRGKNTSREKGKQKKRVGKEKSDIPEAVMVSKVEQTEGDSGEVSQCFLSHKPKAVKSAYLFGGTANSRQEFKNIPYEFKQKSELSIRFKTHYSNGMIFYISDKEENNFLTLFIAHGRLTFMFNVGQHKLRIRSQEKYNDGLWHDVKCIRDKNKGRLIINGLRVIEDSLPATDEMWDVEEPIYLGGVSPGKAVKNVQINSVYSFNGCLSNFRMNGFSITSPSQTFSVTPCFEGPVETGTYISSEGGYVILDDSYNMGMKFELVFEVRPRSMSGILVHIQNVNGEYLNLHMKNGQVAVQVKYANKEFSTTVEPKQNLCDGQWHRIAVIRDGNVIQLDVDSEINHVVGPLNTKALHLKEPVFSGGVPESLLASSLTTRNSFTGCLRNFVIDERPVSFSKASLVSGAVSISVCPST